MTLNPLTCNAPGVALLAQSSRTAANVADILFYLGVIIAAAIVLVIVGVIVRKRYQDDDAPAMPTAFTLADLREMHQQGQLTDAEFDRARKAMIARSRAAYQGDQADDDDQPQHTEDPDHGTPDDENDTKKPGP